MRSLIQYFTDRPLVANVIMFGLIASSILFWDKIGKEEMPEFAMNWVRVSIVYPGASAEDVEVFIIKPIEEKLKGVTNLKEVSSTAAYSSGTFSITFKPNIKNLPEKVQEVKDAVSSVDLPREAEDPIYRQFNSSEKAIIDIGVFLQDTKLLDIPSRRKLQEYVLAFKNKLLVLPEISGVDESGYVRPELQVKVEPQKLEQYELSMNQVKDQIVQQHVRRPLGSMKDFGESEVTITSELNDVPSLQSVIVSSGFQGQKLKLSEIAVVENGFAETRTITKVQGREGIILNIQKSSNIDILTARQAVVDFIENFKKNDPSSPVDFVLMDDESYDVRNRLDIIKSNGVIGFLLIVFVLFLFLDFKSGIWVAMGIPFSLAFTLMMALIMGYTVNNMTLAAIIIVLGIVVDDAIIIAENIIRRNKEGASSPSVVATMEVGSPVIASVLTTCAAFIPLYFFTGRFGLFVKYIPTIVFLMLLASLIESFFILPSHMAHPLKLEGFFNKFFDGAKFKSKRQKITKKVEDAYAKILESLLRKRYFVMPLFLVLLGVSVYIFTHHLKFVMFPREESRDFRLRVIGPEDVKKDEMAQMVESVEDIFLKDKSGVVTSIRTSIGQNRRGGEVRENEASIMVELVPPSERNISFNKLLAQWEEQTDELYEFEEIRFQRSRFGSDSGSPIVLEIQENNDETRKRVVESLKAEMEKVKGLTNIEIERPVTKDEYKLQLKKDRVSQLGISFDQLASTLRSYIEGDILYTLISGEEEVDVRYTSNDNSKDDIERLMKLTVSNRDNYLVPMTQLVDFKSGKKAANIQRTNYKRTTKLFSDLEENSGKTPLEVANYLEDEVFPKILAGSPTTNIQFRGEIEDSRESQSDFSFSITLVLIIIYILLVFLFDSLWTPFLIGAIIPFGIVGTALAFWSHGMFEYGFFAVVGTLGMIGVVINDSIVLIDRLLGADSERPEGVDAIRHIAEVSSTRLRAVVVTTVTTVAGLFPTAYGLGGYDSMLSEMMLAMGWGLLFGMVITLVLAPTLYCFYDSFNRRWA